MILGHRKIQEAQKAQKQTMKYKYSKNPITGVLLIKYMYFYFLSLQKNFKPDYRLKKFHEKNNEI